MDYLEVGVCEFIMYKSICPILGLPVSLLSLNPDRCPQEYYLALSARVFCI